MQTILLLCMAAGIVLLCIHSIILYKRINRFNKRFEQKFLIQNQFNRHFNERLINREEPERSQHVRRFLANGIVLLVLFSFFSSCNPSEKTAATQIPNYTEVNIEGCEYFLYPVTHGYSSLTHKGNCSNPIHYSSNSNTEKR